MALKLNLRHLEEHNVRLEGELPAEELDLDIRDETIQTRKPLRYGLEAQKMEQGLLVQGRLELPLECHCVRCLKRFEYVLEILSWTCHLPLEGEEKAAVLNDCVDLTPYVREDILLEFPQHPLCKAECGGLPKKSVGKKNKTGSSNDLKPDGSAWSELNKLKF
jgi:uncharacterized protein